MMKKNGDKFPCDNEKPSAERLMLDVLWSIASGLFLVIAGMAIAFPIIFSN